MSVILQDSPAVLQAYEEYKLFKSNPEMREKVKARQRFLDEQQLLLGGAFAEGEMRKARETATMMKRKGYPVAEIAEMTGLPPSEIEQLT